MKVGARGYAFGMRGAVLFYHREGADKWNSVMIRGWLTMDRARMTKRIVWVAIGGDKRIVWAAC